MTSNIVEKYSGVIKKKFETYTVTDRKDRQFYRLKNRIELLNILSGLKITKGFVWKMHGPMDFPAQIADILDLLDTWDGFYPFNNGKSISRPK